MHITLTDHLTCPRCGPTAGLVLLMEAAEERRVSSGALGCPVCRSQYRIDGRVADLRLEAGAPEDDTAPVGPARGQAGEAALRVAALLGLTDAGGFVLLDGPAALAVAAALREHVPDVEPAVVIGETGRAAAWRAEVSPLLASEGLPIADRVMRGAAYVGGVPAADRLAELIRVTRPTGRLVVETMGTAGQLDGVADALSARGAAIRARDETGLVAVVF